MAYGRQKARRRRWIAKLSAAVRETLADPAVQERFKAVGQEIWPANEQTPEALAAKQKAELARWSPIIKEAGVRGTDDDATEQTCSDTTIEGKVNSELDDESEGLGLYRRP
jgi:hypothetical protein